MPRRQRWTPVRGTANRVYDRRERWLVQALDLLPRALVAARRAVGPALPPIDLDTVRDVLVLRLDRIGDVLMSLPALHELRAALPQARIRLAVGRWSEEVARDAPVDEVVCWSAPWVGRAQEGAVPWPALLREARGLRKSPPDVALDLQGDVRAALLLRLSGARRRIGYANTGGAWLLTDVVPLDETVSWVEQNRRAVAALIGSRPATPAPHVLSESDRGFAQRLFSTLDLESRRPLVGIHPSGGRTVKQWDPRRWGELGARLQADYGATVLITGSAADRGLAAAVASALPHRAYDLTGRLTVRETLAVIGSLDLFLSSDTGPMHMACAAGTPSVSLFGPSDPQRYFSGGDDPRHVVVRRELWCSPCNLIRKPPDECAGPQMPECLRLVTVDDVHHEAARLLGEVGGYAARPGSGARA